jgi:peptide/nickel transport system substrate-binding protein
MHRPIRHHALAATAAILTAALGVAATAPSAGAASKPKRGAIVYAIPGKTTSFCIPRAQLSASGIMVVQSLYDTLTVPNSKGEYVPYLAKSVTPNATSDEWTIGLRDGVTFADGTPVDAAAVKQNIDAWRRGLLLQFLYQPVSDVSTPDPRTVVVKIKQPWPAFPAFLFSSGRTAIAAPAQLTSPNCETNLIGSGPFKLDSYDPSTGDVTVVRNPNYWRKGYPLLNKISFKVQGNTTQRINGLEGGQFDITFFGGGKNARTARSVAGVTVQKNKPGFRDVNNILFNTQRPPFDDPNARKALAMGLDIQTLNVLANQGEGDIAQEVVDSKVLGYSKRSGFPKSNPAKAKKMVAAYKAAHGGEFAFDLQTTFDPGVQDVGAEVKRQAKKIGISVNLPAPVDEAQIINLALAGKTDAFLWRNYPGSDPDTLYVWFHSGSPVNFGKLDDPVIDQGFEQGRIETDPAKRKAIYTALFRHMSNEVSALWFGYNDTYVASKSTVKGIIGPNLPGPDGRPGKQAPVQINAGYHQLLGISKR